MKDQEIRPGFYQDKNGNWRPDRRKGGPDRRGPVAARDHERRRQFRRQIDRELYETDHKQQIEEALEDFAEEHGGRL